MLILVILVCIFYTTRYYYQLDTTSNFWYRRETKKITNYVNFSVSLLYPAPSSVDYNSLQIPNVLFHSYLIYNNKGGN